ncbi:MAG: hypothetical protein QW303_08090, partial [Nitrososphaerota archaeon]
NIIVYLMSDFIAFGIDNLETAARILHSLGFRLYELLELTDYYLPKKRTFIRVKPSKKFVALYVDGVYQPLRGKHKAKALKDFSQNANIKKSTFRGYVYGKSNAYANIGRLDNGKFYIELQYNPIFDIDSVLDAFKRPETKKFVHEFN